MKVQYNHESDTTACRLTRKQEGRRRSSTTGGMALPGTNGRPDIRRRGRHSSNSTKYRYRSGDFGERCGRFPEASGMVPPAPRAPSPCQSIWRGVHTAGQGPVLIISHWPPTLAAAAARTVISFSTDHRLGQKPIIIIINHQARLPTCHRMPRSPLARR
jgi:hypothetical protein